MIKASDFISETFSLGYNFFSGVPCSFLKPLINYVVSNDDIDYVAAANEGEAVGIAAGAYLAGKKTVVILQNAGLGNMVNPITSLNHPFRIPALFIITLRGEPGLNDEPQHELMGKITEKLLDTMGVKWDYFPTSQGAIHDVLQRADECISRTSYPYALIMKKGSVDKVEVSRRIQNADVTTRSPQGSFTLRPEERKSRLETIELITRFIAPEDAVVATTGKIGRELFTVDDHENQIYIVGSMGLASSIGFGIQKTQPERRVFVLDGDGAAIMKMGTFATVGYYKPGKFTHIILDNETYESTGGQFTVSPTVDFCSVALACGYENAYRADTDTNISEALEAAKDGAGPTLIHIKVADGSSLDLGRPTIKPHQVKERFMRFLQQS